MGGDGSMRVTRAMKRAREGEADRGRAVGRRGHTVSLNVEVSAIGLGRAYSAYNRHSREYHNIDRNPPPPYLPTHPPPPHLLTTTSPAIPALVTAEAVAWSSDPGVAGARELLHGGGDGGRSPPTPQAEVVCCSAANPCLAPPPTLLAPSMSIAPGAGCREAHCTGELPPTSSMPMAQEGACREACPLEQPPPTLKRNFTYPADGGGRRLRGSTTSTSSLASAPSREEGQLSTCATAGGRDSIAACDRMTCSVTL